MLPFEFHPLTRVVYGEGAFERLGVVASRLGFRRVLLVADPGIRDAGYVDLAAQWLHQAGIAVFPFHDFGQNPDSAMVERGRAAAVEHQADSLIGLGGGSSMDCAKAINLLATHGGAIQDYVGYGRAVRPLWPMIGVPTTAGTGSEAQSYCIISDAITHRKMAIGDPQLAFHTAILDPVLTVSQPAHVTAAAGYDALSHAVESYVTTKRNPLSRAFAREAFHLINDNYLTVLERPEDLVARGSMAVGAHLAGLAIENSMLGATHACANPLTARYGTVHGVAISVMLEHVVRWNLETGDYRGLFEGNLPARLRQLATMAGLPPSLESIGVPRDDLDQLSLDAAEQWTGRFNPRPFSAAGARELYQCAF
jgi:alcohol dehydrogenase